MSNEQPHIYLGRIDGKLWLAGPTDQTVPNDYDSERGILSSADRWKSIFHLPRIEYLGQETDFQMHQAVREGVDFEEDYYCCKYNYSIHQCDRQCLAQGRYVANPIRKEPAATIQAIREATNRHTQSPEAARKALIEAGIEPTNKVEFDDTPLGIAATDWVFETNGHRWSNNNSEAADNYGSFIAGAKWAATQTGIAENNGWIKVKGRDWFSKTIKERDVVVLFDTGEVRRYDEENWPFAEVTHYCLLPAKPAPPKTKQ